VTLKTAAVDVVPVQNTDKCYQMLPTVKQRYKKLRDHAMLHVIKFANSLKVSQDHSRSFEI